MNQFNKRILVLPLAIASIGIFGCGGKDMAKPVASPTTPASEPTKPSPGESVAPDSQAAVPETREAPPQDDPAVVAQLEAFGAELVRDDEDRVIHITFPPTTTDDDVARLVNGLPTLRGITLSWTKISDAVVSHLSDLELQRLDLSWTDVTDQSAPALGQLPGLESLKVEGTAISVNAASKIAAALPNARIDVVDAAIVASAKSLAEAPAPATPLEQIQQEYESLREQWITRYRGAADEASQQAVLDDPPDYSALANRALELAKTEPQSAVAYQALSWILTTDGTADWRPGQVAALELVQQHHGEHRNLNLLIGQIAQTAPTTATVPFLRHVIQSGVDEKTTGTTLLALATMLKQQTDFAEQLAGIDDASRVQFESYFGPEFLESLESLDRETTLAEVEQLFEKVAEDYAGYSSLANAAVTQLYVLRNLAVGKPAPEIEGEDIDGVAFKLSDYRGKVVMLDFWGHW